MNLNNDIIERFKSYLVRDKDTGCLIFTGSKKPSGHGRFRVGRRLEYAHRIAWIIAGNDVAKKNRGHKSKRGYPRGVQPCTGTPRFWAYIRVKSKPKYLGSFDTVEEASRAVDLALSTYRDLT